MCKMNAFSQKIFLKLPVPSEEEPASDHRSLQEALSRHGFASVDLPLPMLQKLYPLCRDSERGFTVTLTYHGENWIVTALEPGDTRLHHYGLAVDYGSTTIVMELVDLNSGTVLARKRESSGQIAYGTDILTRITFTMEDPSHAQLLQQATVDTFHRLFDALQEDTGINPRECSVMVISGNTTMIHFLLKLNAWTVFASPFAPVTKNPGWFRGRELGMDFEGLIYIIPAASNYVGGDIISGLIKLDLCKRPEPSLFFDIGTNGELVVGNNEWLLAGAGAAGPALEGYISRYGMQARPGAIDTVAIQGENLTYTTIGGEKPLGICGSGIIDLLAQMRLAGWVNIAGHLNPQASPRIRYLADEKQYAAVYATEAESASGQPLFFTQTDISQYLETKAAAYTMVECLLDTVGFTPDDLSHCYLSGAFSAHSNLESAITIGMFPDLPRDRYTAITNTSLEGARLLLLDHSLVEEANRLAEHAYCFQFASVPDFLVRMQAAKFIPHTDMNRFPTVRKKLQETASGTASGDF